MTQEVQQKYLHAGTTSKKAMKLAIEMCIPGESILNIATQVEKYILEQNMFPSFPVLLSVNDIAAHFSPHDTCIQKLKLGDVVKIDLGAQTKDGYITDMARTIEIGSKKYQTQIECTKHAFEEAFSTINVGVTNYDIAKKIALIGTTNNQAGIDFQ